MVGVEFPFTGVVLPEPLLVDPFNPELSLVGEFAPEPIEFLLLLYGAIDGEVRRVLKVRKTRKILKFEQIR